MLVITGFGTGKDDADKLAFGSLDYDIRPDADFKFFELGQGIALIAFVDYAFHLQSFLICRTFVKTPPFQLMLSGKFCFTQ
jgi:hypothetical protein